MRRVHLVRAALTAALLSVAALTAAPAAAGGPTSALLSIPGAGSTASLYYTDPEYDELANLVGVSEPSGTFETELSGGHESGPGITITWLIHDVQPWRVDRVYLGGKDGPWISTQIMPTAPPRSGRAPCAGTARERRTADQPARRTGAGHRRFQEHRLRGCRRRDRAEDDRGGAARRRARGGSRRHRAGMARARRLGARRAGRGCTADARLDQAPCRRARRNARPLDGSVEVLAR